MLFHFIFFPLEFIFVVSCSFRISEWTLLSLNFYFIPLTPIMFVLYAYLLYPWCPISNNSYIFWQRIIALGFNSISIYPNSPLYFLRSIVLFLKFMCLVLCPVFHLCEHQCFLFCTYFGYYHSICKCETDIICAGDIRCYSLML